MKCTEGRGIAAKPTSYFGTPHFESRSRDRLNWFFFLNLPSNLKQFMRYYSKLSHDQFITPLFQLITQQTLYSSTLQCASATKRFLNKIMIKPVQQLMLRSTRDLARPRIPALKWQSRQWCRHQTNKLAYIFYILLPFFPPADRIWLYV